jgi:hypothetical protein
MSFRLRFAACASLLLVACATDESNEATSSVEQARVVIDDSGGGGGGGGCPVSYPPATLEATTPDCGQVRLQWTAPPSTYCGIVGYKVHRCTTSACTTRTPIGGTHTGLTATDAGPLAQNTLQHYSVNTIDQWGRESTRRIVSVTTPACTGSGGSYGGGLGNPSVTTMEDIVTVGTETYVVSNIKSGSSDHSYTLTKLDANNQTMWQRSFQGSTTSSVAAAAVAANGSMVMVVGRFTGTVTLGSGSPAVSTGGKDIFLQKFDTNGNVQLWRTWGSSNVAPQTREDEGTGVALAGTHVLITAQAGCTIDFGATNNLVQEQQVVQDQALQEPILVVDPQPVDGEVIDSPQAVVTPHQVGYVVKLGLNDMSPNCAGCWGGALQVGDPWVGTTQVVIRDVDYDAATNKIAIAGSFKGEINMANEPRLTTGGEKSEIFAMVFSAGGWPNYSRWISQFGDLAKDEKVEAIAFGDNGASVFLTGDIKGNCNGAICQAFAFRPCKGVTCRGTGTILNSNPAKTIFLAKLSAAPISTTDRVPTLGWAASYPNLANPGTTDDSTAYGVVTGSGWVAIAGEVGGAGITFASVEALSPTGRTAFIAGFNSTSGSGRWSRGAAGSGKTNRLGLDNGKPRLAGGYGAPFHWDNRGYPAPGGGFTATFVNP